MTTFYMVVVITFQFAIYESLIFPTCDFHPSTHSTLCLHGAPVTDLPHLKPRPFLFLFQSSPCPEFILNNLILTVSQIASNYLSKFITKSKETNYVEKSANASKVNSFLIGQMSTVFSVNFFPLTGLCVNYLIWSIIVSRVIALTSEIVNKACVSVNGCTLPGILHYFEGFLFAV